MGIVHAVRSDNPNFTARFSWGGPTPGFVLQNSGVNTPTYGVDTASGVNGAIGGNSINMDRSAAIARAMIWNTLGIEQNGGVSNRELSVLLRARLPTTAAALGLWSRDGNAMNWGANRIAIILSATNGISVSALNEFGQTCINATLGTVAINTNSYHDFVFSWDGSLTAGAVRLFFDGSQNGSATATGTLASTFKWSVCSNLWMGGVSGANNCRLFANEFVVWNNTIDVTSIALADGTTASLNGTARTSFVNVSAFDYVASTDPGTANVKLATNYTIHGTAYVGAYAVTASSSGSGGAQPGIGLPQFL